MNSVITIRREVEKIKQILIPKPEDRIVVRMWLPPDDPRHDMTDAEIERLNPLSRIVVKPLNEWQKPEERFLSS